MFPKVTIKSKLILILGLGLIFLNFFSTTQVGAATLKFAPPTQSFISGCTSSVDVEVDATGENSNAADMEITYNPNEIDIVDSNPDIDGIQIRNGNAYESYVENRVVPSQSKIYLAGVSINSTVTSKKVFGTILFVNKPGVTSTSFQIRLDGVGELFTFDSNVADTATSKDILKSVGNGNYTFAFGYCEKEPPKINFQNPIDRQKNVAIDSAVNIKITDNLSGIDLSTVQFDINNDIYTPSSPEVTYTGDPLAYNFTIKPRNPFYADKSSVIKVVASDKAKNKSSGQIEFDPPFICNPDTQVIINKPADIVVVNKPADQVIYQNLAFKGTVAEPLATGKTPETPVSPLFYYTILAFAGLLFVFLDFLLVNRHRLVTGYATDAITGSPVTYAPIEVYDLVTGKFLSRRDTEKDGKYAFHLLPGEYQLKIDYKGIQWSQSIIVPEINKVKKLNTFINENEKRWEKVAKFFHTIRIALAKLAPGMLLSGFALSILNLYLMFSPINLLITSLYILVYILFIFAPYIYTKYIRRNFEKFDE